MNREALEARIADLEQARRHWGEQSRIAQANMNAAEGALSECRYWLENMMRDGKPGEGKGADDGEAGES